MRQRVLDKGTVSNLISLAVLLAGLALSLAAPAAGPRSGAVGEEALPLWVVLAGPWLLAAGVFGFAGGTTNWLAVRMLFDKVPFLYGSGVIPSRFREIRATIKDLILTHFFDEDYLRRFLQEHAELFPTGKALEERLVTALESEQADEAIRDQLEKLKEGPFGMMVKMAGVDMLTPVIQQFLTRLAVELAPQFSKLGGQDTLDIPALRERVGLLLETKLVELTPETVKQMMEQVMREHLGWLIVWGNVFGGAIGLLSRALALYWGLGE